MDISGQFKRLSRKTYLRGKVNMILHFGRCHRRIGPMRHLAQESYSCRLSSVGMQMQLPYPRDSTLHLSKLHRPLKRFVELDCFWFLANMGIE